jgi:alpha-ketoglutarate-dependent taurine dioxygenase
MIDMHPIQIDQDALGAALNGDFCDRHLSRLRYDVLTSSDWVAHGVAILQGIPVQDDDVAARFIRAVSSGLGTLLPQDKAGAMVREVRYRGVELGEGTSGRYSDSKGGGQLHTDGPHRPTTPPAWFALLCVRQSRIGGDLVLVETEQVIKRLPKEVVETLQGEFYFDQREDGAVPVRRPVLRRVPDGAWHVHYLREYIDLGHRHPAGKPLAAEQLAALDTFDSVVNGMAASRDRRITVKLAPGQLALIDNHRLLHGRTAFGQDPRDLDRLMLRTWIEPSQRHRRRQPMAAASRTV